MPSYPLDSPVLRYIGFGHGELHIDQGGVGYGDGDEYFGR